MSFWWFDSLSVASYLRPDVIVSGCSEQAVFPFLLNFLSFRLLTFLVDSPFHLS